MWTMLFAWLIGCGVGGGVALGGDVGVAVGYVVGFNFTIHRPVRVHLLPFKTVLPLYFTVTPILVKVTSQPASQSVTTDSRECDANPGMMWPICARVGRCGRSSRHRWVEATFFPSGSVTLICLSGISLFAMCASVIRKWLVAPESRIAQFLMLSFVNVIASSSALAAPDNP